MMKFRSTRRVQTVEITRLVDSNDAVTYIVARAPHTPDEVVWYADTLDGPAIGMGGLCGYASLSA